MTIYLERSPIKSFAIVGRSMTWRHKLYQDGEPYDLTGLSVLSKMAKPDATQTTGTVAIADPQVGDDKGRFTVTLSAVKNDTSGDWVEDILVGASGSEQPIEDEYQFQSFDSQTE